MLPNIEHLERWKQKNVFVNLLKTGLILLLTAVVCEGLFRLNLGTQSISIVMMLAMILIASSTDGYVYGIAATVLGVFVFDFLITAPRLGFSFTLGSPLTFTVMLLVTLATSAITARIKKQAELAQEKERRAEQLYDINRKLLSSRDEGTIAEYAMEFLADDLQRSAALFTHFTDQGPQGSFFRQAEGDAGTDFFTEDTEWEAILLAARQGVPTGASTNICGEARGFYWPVRTSDRVYGVFGVSHMDGSERVSHRAFLDLIAEQTAQALRVLALTTQQQEIMVLAETETARNSFLRGISHDLRTPLTSIIGASATLLENPTGMPQERQIYLVEDIQADAQWLLSMVENILSITRIQQHGMTLRTTEEAAEEVVGEAVSLFRKRHPGTDITIRQPPELLLVPMDVLLITQVINNLLDNAWRHTGPGDTQITIGVDPKEGFAEFSVCDNGPGIEADVLNHLFEIRPAKAGHPEDAFRGLGIGLSLCKTIIDLHGGRITAHNLPQGGACFTFTLPMEKENPDGE